MKRFFAATAALACLAAAGAAPAQPAPHSPGAPYAARNLADRIVLSPGADPSTQMAIAYRTDTAQAATEVQLAPGLDGPSLEAFAKPVGGTVQPIETDNGKALYHQARFTGLTPDTAYVYRVRGSAGWSEWLQFRTAAKGFKPFTFLYLGDTQNGILSLGSRVIRQAYQSTSSPALMLHAGDLVAQRDDMIHDDEWGEWTQAGGYNFSTVPQMPATGNHEYVEILDSAGREIRQLGPHWSKQFALPANGAAGVEATTYYSDYQGVRFVVLDGTAALDLGKIDVQTAWLDKVLAEPGPLWRIVVFHQPIYTCARPQDTAALKAAWAPVFERRNVDLVLQGHDHCYSRLSSAKGKDDAKRRHDASEPQGPVYLVSVTGKKMYALNDRALTQPDRVAEDTQLYQVVTVEKDRIGFEARTARGALYDAFELKRGADGRNRLVESTAPLEAQRTCNAQTGPDGAPCTSRDK
jgi:acid phosphatase type 7